MQFTIFQESRKGSRGLNQDRIAYTYSRDTLLLVVADGMLSSKDGLFDRARGRMVGSDQYLTKPFTKESLLKTVANHVNRPVASPAALAG